MFIKSEAPAAERNKNPILEVLKNVIKVPENANSFPSVKILEISSGTGQHITHFAKHMNPQIFWQPTEYDKRQFSSICAYIQHDNLKNVAPPVYVDIREDFTKWKPICNDPEKSVSTIEPITTFNENDFDYIYNSNLIHISSFDCTEGLFYNAGKLLKNGGWLITYGPYGQNGKYKLNFIFFFNKSNVIEIFTLLLLLITGVLTPESNVQFDRGLRMSDPSWGVRDIQQQLIPLAEKNNLKLVNIFDMPSNNKLLLWNKRA